MDFNPYEELGVERDASGPEISRAYRIKSKESHPDVGGTPETWETCVVWLIAQRRSSPGASSL